MTGPVWHEGDIDLARTIFAGPLALQIDLASAAAARLVRHAGRCATDPGAFAGCADAAQRLQRRRLARALIAWAANVHPDQVRMGRSALGAPLVEAPAGWHLSVSGHDGACLIGLAREPIGVDIELASAPPPPLDLLTPVERWQLDRLDPEAREGEALLFWLAKEAHAKRLGRARVMEPGEIEVVRQSGGLQARSKGHASRCWIRRSQDAIAVIALLGRALLD